MKLNMTLRQLAGVLALAGYIANADDEGTVEEIDAAMEGFETEFNLTPDARAIIVNTSTEQTLLESLDLVNGLGPAEKQFASNVLCKVALSDNVLTEGETQVFWQIARICGLPDPQ